MIAVAVTVFVFGLLALFAAYAATDFTDLIRDQEGADDEIGVGGEHSLLSGDAPTATAGADYVREWTLGRSEPKGDAA